MTVISDVSRVLGGSNNLFCQKTGIHLWQMRAVKIHSPNDYQRSVSEFINNITNRKTNIDGNKVGGCACFGSEWRKKNPISIHTRVDYLCSHACKHKYIPLHNIMQVVCMHVLT